MIVSNNKSSPKRDFAQESNKIIIGKLINRYIKKHVPVLDLTDS